MGRLLPALLIAFTLLQLRSAECRVACLNGGWDDGDYLSRPVPTCRCSDLKSYEVMAHQKRLTFNRKKDAPPDPSTPHPKPGWLD